MGNARGRIQEERGATAVIVVLSLFALFGMVILTVDVGGLLWARRGMVNASDAAALAAAQSCIDTTIPLEFEEGWADQLATSNADGVVTAGNNISAMPNCHQGRTGYVSVEYTRQWPLFFGGVLGAGNVGQVTTAATAFWGASGSTAPIPLVIYVTALQGPCDVPNVAEGTTCYIWEANDFGVGGGNFGFLDVEEGWNVPKAGQCNNSGGANQVEEWISGPPIQTAPLNYPNATWVCTREMEGGNNPAWQAIEDLIGEERDFPIVGPTPGDGEPWFIETPQSKYNVIGFAHFEIMDVRMVSKLESGEVTCSGINAATPQPVDLMACVGAPSDATYANDASFTGNWGSTNPQIDADGMLTWTGNLPNGNKSVKFHYDDLLSNCGGIPPPDGNASAHCLVLKWNGATIGGSDPGGGAELGLNSVRLCDLEIGSCPDLD